MWIKPESLSPHKRTAVQLVREFWLQLFVSAIWAAYQTSHSTTNLFGSFVANFSVSFFFTSWLFGQIVRVRRQQGIEDEFKKLKSDLERLLAFIEQQTQHLVGYTTGGDSIGYFEPSWHYGTMRVEISFWNNSTFPIFDVLAEWIDLDESVDFAAKKFWTRHLINLGTIYPNKVALNVLIFDMATRKQLRLNIFVQTRNRNFTQLIRVANVDDSLKFATRKQLADSQEDNIASDFPNFDPADPDKVFT
jgi:hypothetical protein